MLKAGKKAKEFERKAVELIREELAEYKNTGLTPEEILELKERDTAKVPNKKLRHRGALRLAIVQIVIQAIK